MSTPHLPVKAQLCGGSEHGHGVSWGEKGSNIFSGQLFAGCRSACPSWWRNPPAELSNDGLLLRKVRATPCRDKVLVYLCSCTYWKLASVELLGLRKRMILQNQWDGCFLAVARWGSSRAAELGQSVFWWLAFLTDTALIKWFSFGLNADLSLLPTSNHWNHMRITCWSCRGRPHHC